ncbi:MAG: dihydrodipicolinate synthase family protein, partial [Rhodobacteraceae bacterium]|nr:dihydrodipicolinate synthase family protein [Paracoccaceae bacterium]
MKFEGIYTPLVAPFFDDFTLNHDAMQQTVDLLVNAGVHGIIVAGTTGEYYAMSMKERVYMMGVAKEMIAGRVPMIIGTGAIRTEDSVLDRLGRSPNFCAIKESSGDPNRLHMLARDYPHIALSCGMDDQALEFFAWGARSWVCAGSNFAPEAHIALYQACAVEGDFTKGRAIMSAMLPLMRVLEQGGKFIQCIKHGLTMRGIDVGPPRKPLQPLNKDDKRELEQVIKTMNTTINRITGA